MASPYRIVVWQLLATVAVVAVLILWELGSGHSSARWWGFHQSASALAAGLVSVIPAALYAWRAAVERSATRFLLQGVLKFGLTLVGLGVCIVLVEPAPAGFFGTFALLHMLYALVPLLEYRKEATSAEAR